MLITNSDFAYTDKMMSYAYDEYLPEGKTWRDLFDMVQPRTTSPHVFRVRHHSVCRALCVSIWHCLQVIIQARKPEFFNYPSMSLFEIVTKDGLMRPCFNARKVPARPGAVAVYPVVLF